MGSLSVALLSVSSFSSARTSQVLLAYSISAAAVVVVDASLMYQHRHPRRLCVVFA